MVRLLQMIGDFVYPPGSSGREVMRSWLDGLSPVLQQYAVPLDMPPAGEGKPHLTIGTVEAATDLEWEWVIVVFDRDADANARDAFPEVRAFLHNATSRAGQRLDVVISPKWNGGVNQESVQLIVDFIGDIVPMIRVGNGFVL